MTTIAKKGNTHLEIKNLSWTFNTTKLHIELDNLFNGNKELGK